jgi:hypothetical protein
MGLFDFLKKNKNIITDNGHNIIYFDNGKGSIKEEFSKINGVLTGDYINYNRNGTFQKKTYKDGVICLTDEQKQESKRKEEKYNNIEEKIAKLKIIDNLFLQIPINLILVQLENPTLDYYSNLISDKFSEQFDKEFIKFYLYTKRNYFIKNLIQFGESKDLNISFSEHINNYQKTRTHSHKIRWEYWHKNIFDDIIDRILKDEIKGKSLGCGLSITENGLDKDIFLQENTLFGLNHKDYLLIHEILLKYEKQKDQQISDINYEEFREKSKGQNEFWDELFKEKKNNEHQDDEVIIERAVKEIKLICKINKVNQEQIIIEL